MPIIYKINVINSLKEKGLTTYKIRKENIFSEGTLQKFREKKPVSWENLEKICKFLDCQPGDILEYREIQEKD